MAPNSRSSKNLTAHLEPGESNPQLPRSKLTTALTRLKSFGGSFVNQRKAPTSIIFPPPSWELSDELLGRTSPALLESNFEAPVPPEAPEAVSFARRLRILIESLPISLPGLSSSSSSTSETDATQDDGKQGSPVPPGMDEGLFRMLSSEEVMNGNLTGSGNGTDKERPGIWNILASLRKSNEKSDNPRPSAVEEEEDGFMMYAPLEPKNDSQLELAESEMILEYVDEPTPGDRTAPGKSTANSSKKRSIEKHIWMPSTTELSILTTWWGYRLYLPPPVMAKLDGTSMKATARAAMLTTALKWMLDKIPLMLVPIQFWPAVTMLKQLGPLVDFIGVFISWSWDRVRACDKGNGVVLTATWLLPVALLPMAWDAGDIYGPRPLNTSEERSAVAEVRAPASEDGGKSGEQGKKQDNLKKDKQKSKLLFSW